MENLLESNNFERHTNLLTNIKNMVIMKDIYENRNDDSLMIEEIESDQAIADLKNVINSQNNEISEKNARIEKLGKNLEETENMTKMTEMKYVDIIKNFEIQLSSEKNEIHQLKLNLQEQLNTIKTQKEEIEVFTKKYENLEDINENINDDSLHLLEIECDKIKGDLENFIRYKESEITEKNARIEILSKKLENKENERVNSVKTIEN